MSDLVIQDFGGILSAVDPRDIPRNKFTDGQNFVIDQGALKKRNGFIKTHTARLAGRITGIAYLNARDRGTRVHTSAGLAVTGEVVIIAGSRAYSGKF